MSILVVKSWKIRTKILTALICVTMATAATISLLNYNSTVELITNAEQRELTEVDPIYWRGLRLS